MTPDEVKKYCETIYKIIGKNRLNKTSSEVIVDYYTKSAFFYRKFHSKQGAMHFPVQFSAEVPHTKKLLFQADTVNEIINQNNYKNILELGCGMGFNTQYLAEINPDKHFTGIDLTPNNITIARNKCKALNNVQFKQGDFDNLEKTNTQYDLIFAVETLCHSKNLGQLLQNTLPLLSDKGKIILFDGYVKNSEQTLTNKYDKQAYQLLTWGFAMDNFQQLDEIKQLEKSGELNITSCIDYSENVLSNAKAFQKGAKKALQYPLILKTLLKLRLVPLALLKQISAGLFSHYFIQKNYLGYYKLELTKKL